MPLNVNVDSSSNSITPQGDGNLSCSSNARMLPFVQIPLPRRGRKQPGMHFQALQSEGSNSITPQGDGNQMGPMLCNHREFKFHYPARGRKPKIKAILALQILCSNSTTPQGDGNWHKPFYMPRLLVLFKFHYPARGRKHVCCTLCETSVLVVQIPLPRKGTETICNQL